VTAASDGNNAVTWNWIEHEKLTLRLNTVGFAARNPGSIRWKLQFQLLETIVSNWWNFSFKQRKLTRTVTVLSYTTFFYRKKQWIQYPGLIRSKKSGD